MFRNVGSRRTSTGITTFAKRIPLSAASLPGCLTTAFAVAAGAAIAHHTIYRHFSTSKPHYCHSSTGAPEAAAAAETPEKPNIRILTTDGKEITEGVKRYINFAEFPDIPEWLLDGCKRMGFKKATDIQSYTMPLLHDGKDVIGLAPTGSGKTVAFALPALATFRRNKSGNPAVLVLAPVRELVQQTAKVFRDLGGPELYVCEAYGGEPRHIQAGKVSQGCDVLVACPGRLKDFLDSNVVSLSEISFFVLDEADRLLDMGFKIQLDEIIRYMDSQRHRQSMMWSATWPKEVQHLAKEFLNEERIMVKSGTAGEGSQINYNISQEIMMVRSRSDKVRRLQQIFDEQAFRSAGKVIIFVERQVDCDNLANCLVEEIQVNPNEVAALHGGMQQMMRDKIMQAFKQSRVRILIATDVASRGLDFPDIVAVINFDSPKQLDSYCHRIGRTGRAGRKGKAYTFMDSQKASALHGPLYEYLLKCKMNSPKDLARLGEEYEYYENQKNQKRNRYGDSRGRRDGGGGRGGGFGGRDRGGYGGPQQSVAWGAASNRADAMDENWN
eukprot:Tbor_TRINITY_DN5241_c0_g2::TRINITY_DN5241_c0_g2_i1::g.16334::m.16334/K12823/DDX5, DBP2; ATP-dependent RNA helicase DDX5/DBP2